MRQEEWGSSQAFCERLKTLWPGSDSRSFAVSSLRVLTRMDERKLSQMHMLRCAEGSSCSGRRGFELTRNFYWNKKARAEKRFGGFFAALFPKRRWTGKAKI
jgi:hypothetical protein